LLILKLRPCYAPTKIFVNPAEIDVEVFFDDESLFYTFYNGTDRTQFEITVKIDEDNEEIFSKLRASKSDPLLYKYFVRKAMVTESPIKLEEAATTYPEIMTAEQLASYAQVDFQTIRNKTSKKEIPFEKFGSSVRYRKEDIDAWMKGQKRKRPASRRNSRG
jgi:excisionase family DNA binding protein